MIIFKSIKYKNFLSSGNYFTEIPLDKSKSTLIVGHNGAGKSTMLDAISFALFGKPHRKISKNQLINTINAKGTLVEVEFSIGKQNYKVIRGIKPNKFEIWVNGNMVNQDSHAKEYQSMLEKNILMLSHKSFHQIVVLGSSSFVPFMQLAGGSRREVIEDLLDINMFSKMNGLLKEKVSILKDQIASNSHQLNLVDTKINAQKKYLRDLSAISSHQKKQKLDTTKIETLSNSDSGTNMSMKRKRDDDGEKKKKDGRGRPRKNSVVGNPDVNKKNPVGRPRKNSVNDDKPVKKIRLADLGKIA